MSVYKTNTLTMTKLFILIAFVLLDLHTCGIIETNVFKKLENVKVKSDYVINDVITITKFRCASMCVANSDCVTYSYSESFGNCLISNLKWLVFHPNVVEDDTNYVTFVSGYTDKQWTLVFRGEAGIGSSIYHAFISGVNVTSDNDVKCLDPGSATCYQHYRNQILDTWSSEAITRVRYSVFKDAYEVAFIEFDGTGSDITSWFDVTRIVDTSYPRITDYSYEFFSLYGFNEMRTFYTVLTHTVCMSDQMYSAVIENGAAQCGYEIHDFYPQILYATGEYPGLPEAGMNGMDYADCLAVFIKL